MLERDVTRCALISVSCPKCWKPFFLFLHGEPLDFPSPWSPPASAASSCRTLYHLLTFYLSFQMAQRLMLRRFLSTFGRSVTGAAQPFPGYLSPCTRTHGLLSTTAASPVLTTARTIHVSPSCRVTFNVQNKDDFEDRVIGSDTPIIVDFHAQWVKKKKNYLFIFWRGGLLWDIIGRRLSDTTKIDHLCNRNVLVLNDKTCFDDLHFTLFFLKVLTYLLGYQNNFCILETPFTEETAPFGGISNCRAELGVLESSSSAVPRGRPCDGRVQ